jgi:hypothetical protein
MIGTVLSVGLVATTASIAAPGLRENQHDLATPTGQASVRVASQYFETPSHNIACGWFAEGTKPSDTYLRCEIRSLLSPMPKRPPSCDVDWGYGMSIASTGGASVLCAGDTIRRQGSRSILAYGATWRRQGFVCTSAFVGLTCRNTSGHGFFLSRERWKRF